MSEIVSGGKTADSSPAKARRRLKRQLMSSIPIAIRWHRRRLLKEATEAYVEWREQCSAVGVAYSHWATSRASDAARCYMAYSDALDREECASARYAGLILRIGELVSADRQPMEGLAAAGGGQS
jgi:hypothetical protein